jgi:hypothetical protein
MKRLVYALLAFAGLSGGARAADYTDLWYNPLEPGYGVNVVQQAENAFVTLFVYGANGEPLWLVSSDATVVGYIGALPQFRGTLYKMRGPDITGPFDPRQVHATAVGTLYLSFSWYAGSFRLRMSLPGGTLIGHREYNADFLFHLAESGEAVLRVEEAITGLCEYRGPYNQSGRYGYFAGSFTCTKAAGGTFEVSRLEMTEAGITGQLATFGPEIGRGRFGAVRM